MTIMISFRQVVLGAVSAVALLLDLGLNRSAAQGQQPDALPMVLELLRSPDRDTRGLALQQIREGLRGKSVTETLVQQLPSLSPDAQAALLETLADRADPAARPGILTAVDSPVASVRTAALAALGSFSEPGDLPLLARKAADGSAPERAAARRSLIRARGEGINTAIVDLLGKSDPGVKVEALRALAARKATFARPAILRCASDPEPSVRIAALSAVEVLAEPEDTAALIHLLSSAQNGAERTAAEAALLSLTARGRESCLDAVVAGVPGAQPPMRIVLLQALAAIGGPKALRTVTQGARDPAPPVRDESLRLLSEWPEPNAVPCLLDIAERTTNSLHHVLALRGLVRLASTQEKRPPDLSLLRKVWKLTARPEERRLVLGALNAGGTPAALALAAEALDDPNLAEEAALAVVSIAEKLQPVPDACRRALENARQRSNDPALRQRADQLLRGMTGPAPTP